MQKTSIDFTAKVEVEAARAIYRPDHIGAVHLEGALSKSVLAKLKREATLVMENCNGEQVQLGAVAFRGSIPTEYPTIAEVSAAYVRDVYNPLSETIIDGRGRAFPTKAKLDEVMVRKYAKDKRTTGGGLHTDGYCMNLVGILSIHGIGYFDVRSRQGEDVFHVGSGSLVLLRTALLGTDLDDIFHSFRLAGNNTRFSMVLRVHNNHFE